MSTGEARHPSDVALALLLAALTILLGFEAGGYFADSTGWAAAGLALALGASALIRGRPPDGVTRPLLVAAAALALLALWTLLSGEWSGAWGRALIEFDRVLFYLLALMLFATARSPKWTLRRLPAAFALAALVLCGSGVFVTTLPESWPFALPPATMRLEYPLGYENALGALAALGLVFTLHVSSWREEHPALRVVAAAGLPVLATALTLTFSRGALAAAVVGVAAYAVLGLSRGTLMTLLAAGVPVALTVNGTLDADLLGSRASRSPAALAQGEDLAILIVWATAGAGVLRAAVMPLERRLPRPSPRRVRLGVLVSVVALGLAAAAALALATVGSEAVDDLGDSVVDDGGGEGEERRTGARRARDRFSNINVRGQSRPKYWRVSLDAFEREPLRGAGAGAFEKLWARERPIGEDVTEGHSLYLETLAELGLVGGTLLLVVLVSVLAPLGAQLRRRSRPLGAAFVAGGVTWLLHAGFDWDWEMPVLGLWLFAAAGCALASRGRPVHAKWGGRWPARLGVAALCALVAITPASVAFSQWRLDRAHDALVSRDCEEAEREARESISAVSSRAEPYALLAYCAARNGDHGLSLRRMWQAIERDPGSWELVYGLALVRGAAGIDPRPAAQAARRLNPRDELTRMASNRFATDDPRVWRREAKALPLPLLVEP